MAWQDEMGHDERRQYRQKMAEKLGGGGGGEGGGRGGGGGRGAPAPAPAPAPMTGPPPPPNISAQADPTLNALNDSYSKYIGDIDAGTGRVLDIATSRTRDAGSGLEAAARENASERGVSGSGAETSAVEGIRGATERNAARERADIAVGREGLKLSALAGQSGNAATRVGAMLGEKKLGLEGYGAHQNAMQAYNAAEASKSQTAFQQMLALLEAKRTSPLYVPPDQSGYYMGGAGGGGTPYGGGGGEWGNVGIGGGGAPAPGRAQLQEGQGQGYAQPQPNNMFQNAGATRARGMFG